MGKITYELNGGEWAPKDEVKIAFYEELYNFVNARFDTELKDIALTDFVTFEPYIIGNMVGKYFLKEKVGGKFAEQPADYFVGYLYHNKKFLELIPHLEHFFALWREIENCPEDNATDFYANSWASLVDTAKFFKYTTVEDLEKSNEAPSVRDPRILDKLQNCPGRYFPPAEVSETADLRFPIPRREGYQFAGWYDNKEFKGKPLNHIAKGIKDDVRFYARWSTHTFFHSNDGYPTFEHLYDDFLKDFSNHIGEVVSKNKVRIDKHGFVTDFCKASFDGKLNSFFAVDEYRNKWQWLIDFFISLKKTDEFKEFFNFENGKFGSESHVRWELNSLFIGRFHLVWPLTGDYSGVGIKEKLADSTNSQIIKVKYLVNDEVEFPIMTREGYKFIGWFDNPEGNGEEIKKINDDRFADKIIYAKWQ